MDFYSPNRNISKKDCMFFMFLWICHPPHPKEHDQCPPAESNNLLRPPGSGIPAATQTFQEHLCSGTFPATSTENRGTKKKKRNKLYIYSA